MPVKHKGSTGFVDINIDRFRTKGMKIENVERILFTRKQIIARVEQLARDVTGAFGDENITVMPVLTGAMFFAADLIRCMTGIVRIQPIMVSSYPGRSLRSKGCKFTLPPGEISPAGNVLIVDDIFDSGQTMKFIMDHLASCKITSVKGCVLLRKSRPDLPNRENLVDFTGFEVPDRFVVGYGLDYDGLYRNLPDIGILAFDLESQVDS